MFKKLLLLILAIICQVNGFYTTVPEGHVGIYVVFGQIQDTLLTQFSFYNPITSTVQLVKVIQDNDHIENVECVSKEGVRIILPDIEIANTIKKDRVINTVKKYGFDYDKKLVVRPLAQYMRELCAVRTVEEIEIIDFHSIDDLLKKEIQRQNDIIGSGVTVDYVRVFSVITPESIRKKRLELAEEKATKILREEQMKRVEIEKNTQALIAKLDNDIKLETAKMENARLLADIEAGRERRQVENAMLLESTETHVKIVRMEALANAEKLELDAKGQRLLFEIPDYANVEKMKAISDNTQMIYWGDKLPSAILLNPTNTQQPNLQTPN
jgi:hypothetical protein